MRVVVFTLFMVVTAPLPLCAGSQTFLFWYPGAEGTPEQAEPILETLTDYLAKQGLTDHPLTAVYRNDPVSEADKIIKKIKPLIAIVTPEIYLHLSEQHPVTVLAQTRNQTSGNDMIHYTIFKRRNSAPPDVLLMTEPLSPSYVQNILLRNVPEYRNLPLKYVVQGLFHLKQIGQGEQNGAILLNDHETAVLMKLNTTWSQALDKVVTSPMLPSPPLVLFNENKKDYPAEKLVQILMSMKDDPEGIEILKELRLVGFSAPLGSEYEALRASMTAP
jgi:hypothetical protein